MVAEGVFTTGLLSTYCTTEAVFALLRGYDLSAFGGEEALEPRVRDLLVISMGMVETAAGRDFLWHADETVLVDGDGTNRVQVLGSGVSAPVMVKQVKVNGREVPGSDWRCYPWVGILRLTPEAGLSAFPKGAQNVELLVDWGYEETPTEVALAQAKLAAAELLAELGGEGGTVRESRIGDYAVRYAEDGRYGSAVKRWCEEAERALRRYRTVRMAAV